MFYVCSYSYTIFHKYTLLYIIYTNKYFLRLKWHGKVDRRNLLFIANMALELRR